MKIAIIGGSGLIGSALNKKLEATIVSRSGPVTMDDFLGKEMFCRYDVIINLAGQSIDTLWWSKRTKNRIINSRCDVIQRLTKAAIAHNHAPWLIQASGQSYYGLFEKSLHRFTEQEAPEPSNTCMQNVAYAIEKSCKSYPGQTTILRIAPVLTPSSGVFSKLTMISRLRLHLVPGSGRQMFSWIALEDLVASFEIIFKFKLMDSINMASPNAVSFDTMYRSIQSILPGLKVHIPAIFYRLILGEKSQLILLGNEMYPEKLLQHKMVFQYPNFETFCHHALDKP